MRYGKSILLGEIVHANEADYGDCGTFQIVCPNCYESVFKCGRYRSEQRQYFSHYAASKSDVRECELRVGALKPEDIASINAVGQGQALEKFLAVMRQIFMQDAAAHGITPAKISSLAGRKTFGLMIYDLRENMRANFDRTWNLTISPSVIQHLMDRRDAPRNSMQVQRSVSIAYDVMKHLISHSAIANLRLAAAAAVYVCDVNDSDPIRRRDMLMNFSDTKLRNWIKRKMNDEQYRLLMIGLFADLATYLLFFPFIDYKVE